MPRTHTSFHALPHSLQSAATCRLLQVTCVVCGVWCVWCVMCVVCGVSSVRPASSHLGTGDRIEFNKSQIFGAYKDEKCLIFPADFKVSLLFEPDKSRFNLHRVVVDARCLTRFFDSRAPLLFEEDVERFFIENFVKTAGEPMRLTREQGV